ncbi:hypothetical protein JCM4814A_94690 [Streptomyces phaeofaciens JCM 4814]|uniref:Uncharacterized protein n=1 Tax=Streptomyces phaeofaciens TaxID=68254 RepID=A0A918M1X9_9ACTN|nr:hypothetical protein GCM10010226_88430 [Streptomyces phaeofaciens]
MCVSVRLWESYRHDPELTAHAVLVRGQLLAVHPVTGREGDIGRARRGRHGWRSGRGSGRPAGTRDGVPRKELVPCVAVLLGARPAVTAAEVSDRFGIHPNSAQRVLSGLGARAVAKLLGEPDTTSARVAFRRHVGRDDPSLSQRRAVDARAGPGL